MRHALTAAGSEEFVAHAAVGTFEVAHVLDDAEQRAMDLAEHTDGAQRVGERNVLRRADDHDTVEGDQLGEGELSVAGAGREVDNEEIEGAPQGILEELAYGTHHHRAAPDHGSLVVEEEADRDELHAVFFDGIEILAAGRARTIDAGTEHHRNRGTVDVGVEQSDLVAEAGQRDGEICGDGRFADAALAAGNRDDPASALEADAAGAFAEFGFELANLEFDFGDAEVVSEHLVDARADLAKDLLLVTGLAKRDGKSAVGDGGDFFDNAERNDIGGVARVVDTGERSKDILLGEVAWHEEKLFQKRPMCERRGYRGKALDVS